MSRSCVVTGAGRGIGRAIAARLLDDGWHVVALDLRADALAWLAQHSAAARAQAVFGDATDERAARRALEAAVTMAPLAGWVNNAAVYRTEHAATTTVAEVRTAVAINLDAAIVGSIVAAHHFLAAGTPGAIVNLSSLQARQSLPGWVAYATAKAGIEGLTRSLAVDVAPAGIRVNAIAPGTIGVDVYFAWQATAAAEEIARVEHEMGLLHPLGRIGRVEEVAGTAAYLLSEDAGFVTGATIPVDGGRSVVTRDPEL